LPIDNDVYNGLGEGRWEEITRSTSFMGVSIPGRFAYFRDLLTSRLGLDPGRLRALDMGCGGGFLRKSSLASVAKWSGWVLLGCRSRRRIATRRCVP
jgi:hypothetical protein